MFLLGTGCEKAFFRLNTQTEVKQNSRLFYYLAELAVSAQKYFKIKLIGRASRLLYYPYAYIKSIY